MTSEQFGGVLSTPKPFRSMKTLSLYLVSFTLLLPKGLKRLCLSLGGIPILSDRFITPGQGIWSDFLEAFHHSEYQWALTEYSFMLIDTLSLNVCITSYIPGYFLKIMFTHQSAHVFSCVTFDTVIIINTLTAHWLSTSCNEIEQYNFVVEISSVYT